jgi:hypothetical protein
MQYDFRDVYGSLLMDWFGVEDQQVRGLLYPDFTYLPLIRRSANRVLPVDLLSFVATGKDATVELDWQTANERLNKGFEVERSTDGLEFDFVGFVAAAAQEGGGSHYHFTDREVRADHLYYYRLRQVDHDGSYSHSPIVTVRLRNSAVAGWAVGLPYPNPAAEFTTLSVHAPADGVVRYAVVDMTGNQVMQDSEAVVGRRDNQLRIDTARLPGGAYTLLLHTGQRRVSRKLIVR